MVLKDAIIRFNKSTIKAGDGIPKGKFPLYTCSPVVNKYLDDYLFDDEAIILGTGGNPSINYCNGKFAVSTDCLTMKATEKFSTKYLYYYLIGNIKKIESMFRGAGLKHLNKNELMKMQIDNIEKEKQNKIVKKLDKIQQVIDIRKKQKKQLDELIKSQFVEMFGCKQDGFKCPTIQFSECVSNMLKGPFGSDIKKSLYVPKAEDTYKVYIQVNAIQKDENLGDYYISKEYFDSKMYKFEVKPLDYIVTCDGTLGKLLRLDDNMEKGIISASLLKITLNEKISYKYFEEVWNQYMLGELSKDIRNACLTHLPSAKVIGSLHIPLPSKELQDKYTKIVEQIDKQKFEIKKSLKEMQELYESLMEKYFG